MLLSCNRLGITWFETRLSVEMVYDRLVYVGVRFVKEGDGVRRRNLDF